MESLIGRHVMMPHAVEKRTQCRHLCCQGKKLMDLLLPQNRIEKGGNRKKERCKRRTKKWLASFRGVAQGKARCGLTRINGQINYHSCAASVLPFDSSPAEGCTFCRFLSLSFTLVIPK